jgi:hypothetical protein
MLYEIGDSEEKLLQEIKAETASAFVVLQTAYDEVRRWADAIFHTDDYFPSLFSVRPHGSRAKKPAAAGGDTGSSETA